MSVDVSYHTVQLRNADEATSLAGYLNEHGVFAVAAETRVEALSEDISSDRLIRTLKVTWRTFWDNSDSGLFGLAHFIKDS